MPQKKISIEDVARRAKVSITTVSRVINNVPTVSRKNRANVEEAIAHLKFKPNISAQRLARGYNNSIGLVMPGYPGIFYSFYAVELIRGVGHACETKRLDLVFHITNGDNPMNTSNVGGIIFADIIENRKQVESAIAVGTPCLIINNKVDDLDVSYIAVDNNVGGRIAADYLVSLKHKRIATITGNLNTQAGLHRFEGFQTFLQEKNVGLPEEYIFKGDYSRRCARTAMKSFLELPNPPTAVFACSDEMALEAVAVILEKGLKIPDDISIIGFDDNPACLFGSIALTTVKQPLFKMAEESVYLLSSIMGGKGKFKKRIVLNPELVVRESCGPCRS
ncbi:MAG: LacI family DNA-binding transcriptional regulator [Candidatus Omnitrophica bacterium]|nr:LacI family DNA-binding transcriptional regulator [Candidatus Omnitrophota bacterium]